METSHPALQLRVHIVEGIHSSVRRWKEWSTMNPSSNQPGDSHVHAHHPLQRSEEQQVPHKASDQTSEKWVSWLDRLECMQPLEQIQNRTAFLYLWRRSSVFETRVRKMLVPRVGCWVTFMIVDLYHFLLLELSVTIKRELNWKLSWRCLYFLGFFVRVSDQQ